MIPKAGILDIRECVLVKTSLLLAKQCLSPQRKTLINQNFLSEQILKEVIIQQWNVMCAEHHTGFQLHRLQHLIHLTFDVLAMQKNRNYIFKKDTSKSVDSHALPQDIGFSLQHRWFSFGIFHRPTSCYSGYVAHWQTRRTVRNVIRQVQQVGYNNITHTSISHSVIDYSFTYTTNMCVSSVHVNYLLPPRLSTHAHLAEL